VSGDPTYIKGLAAALYRKIPLSNRSPDHMTKLIMTGVTAISRTSAFKIDAAGDPALPARKVAAVLKAADLTHVSNETPFTDACKPVLGTLQLCSKPAYLEALKLAGVDLISSTGNHMNDYGIQAFRDTLDLFDADGFKVFGGGRNIDEASRVLVVEDHGNKLAFLGMNSFGPASVWATRERPGAQQYDKDILHRELAAARQQADVVFLDMQADETYEYVPDGNNVGMFRDAIANGADVVTGVQAHQPQALEFTPDGKQLILYGLGNLFFDQMQSDNVRQGLVVRHTIYNGRLIQTELLPTLLEDYVQPRWASPREAAGILKLVFDASGFK
jgi:poly-gamma-glutamate synthesis protein (capsule biosynthesis protein)